MSLSSRLPCLLPAFRLPSSLTAVLLLLCLSVLPGPGTATDPGDELGCHKRTYTFLASKPSIEDPATGATISCSGYVTVNACWGRCDSNEIGDFEMPYKISTHPVCAHSRYVDRTFTLSDCEGYPDPTMTFADALECACEPCTNRNGDVSCEPLH